MRHKSNSELFDWLRAHPYLEMSQPRHKYGVVYRSTKRRLRDRLTERDLVRMMMAYETGMATKALAERYSINIKSVKKLLRQYRMERRS